MKDERLKFEGDKISIFNYPFRPGRGQKCLAIPATEVIEADVERCVLLVADELIYLPGWPREELLAFCESHNIPIKRRYDAWADILDPFVDTSFTMEEAAKRKERLKAAGFGPARVARLHLLVALPMFIFQGIAGEWTGLYHYDLLYSLRLLRMFGLYGIAYRATMKVALEPYSISA